MYSLLVVAQLQLGRVSGTFGATCTTFRSNKDESSKREYS